MESMKHWQKRLSAEDLASAYQATYHYKRGDLDQDDLYQDLTYLGLTSEEAQETIGLLVECGW